MTAKLSIRKWDTFYKSGVRAWKVLCLTPGDLQGVRGIELRLARAGLTALQKSAEGVVVTAR